MSSFFSNMRGFARGNNKTNISTKPGNQSPTGFGQTLSPSQSNLLPSPSPSLSAHSDHSMNQDGSSRRPPFFFREQYANLIVKGNFMTLAAKPVLVEEGEWLAHQVVEQCRLLDGMLKVIQETDRNTGLPICNQHSCPSMTAGPGVTYTWLDQNKQSVRVPAPQYIAYVQRWITGKITDPSLFPTESFTGAPPSLTPLPPAYHSMASQASPAGNGQQPDNWLGKASGFPASFASDTRNIYRQMFRCYAHAYHSHWTDFYHLSAYKELNTCFIHFVNVGRLFALLNDRDLEPMGPLVDIWLEKGWLPRPSASASAAPSSQQHQQQQQQQQAAGSPTAARSGGESQSAAQQLAGGVQSASQNSLSPGVAGRPPGSAGSGV